MRDDGMAGSVEQRGQAAGVAGGDPEIVDAGRFVYPNLTVRGPGTALVQHLDKALVLLRHITSYPLPSRQCRKPDPQSPAARTG